MGATHRNVDPVYFLLLCGHLDRQQAPDSIPLCEILVFQKGVVGDTLINLQSNDINQMAGIITW
jgi:hypothetical protein